jgi:hypothetical protein
MAGVGPAAETIETQQMAIDLATDVQRLNALDDVWTGYLRAEPDKETVERDVRELARLTGEMGELLARVAQGAGSLRNVIETMQGNLDERLAQALQLEPFGGILMEMRPEQPFAHQVTDACSIVVSEAGAEIEALRAKFSQLLEEGYAPGDIGRRMKCAILLVGAGASLVGLLLTPVAPPAGITLGAGGILVSTIVSANGWNCKRAGDLAADT